MITQDQGLKLENKYDTKNDGLSIESTFSRYWNSPNESATNTLNNPVKTGIAIVGERPYLDGKGNDTTKNLLHRVIFRACPKGVDKQSWYTDSSLAMMTFNYYDFNPNGYEYGSSHGDAIEQIKDKNNVTFDCDIRCEDILPDNDGAPWTYSLGKKDVGFHTSFVKRVVGGNGSLALKPEEDGASERNYGGVYISTWGVFAPEKDGMVQLGQASQRFYSVWAKNGVIQTSDRREKKDISYLDINKNDISMNDCAKFVKDDLKLATYKFKENKSEEQQIGFIAQDIMDTKLGSLIVEKGETEEDRLTYSLSNYVNVLAGALKESLNKIDTLEKRLEKLEK